MALAFWSVPVCASPVQRFPLPTCGGLPALEDADPEKVVRWLDAHFLELAAVFPESTQRWIGAVYFHDAFVLPMEGLARERGRLVDAELVNTGSEVVPYVALDKAIVRLALVRRAALFTVLLGELAPRHAETERMGIARAYWRGESAELVAWSRLVRDTVQSRLATALSAIRWNELARDVADASVARLVEAGLAPEGETVLERPRKRRQRRSASVERAVRRALAQRLAREDAHRPCRLVAVVDVPRAAPAAERPWRLEEPTSPPALSAARAAHPRAR